MSLVNTHDIKKDELIFFYADDDEDDLGYFKDALDELKVKVDLYTHADGDLLMKALENPPPKPTVIFLDLNMPGKNGFEVLEEMLPMVEYKNMPVVVLSTSNDPDIIERCKQLGATQYIVKPSTFSGLKNSIKHVIDMDWSNYKREEKFAFSF